MDDATIRDFMATVSERFSFWTESCKSTSRRDRFASDRSTPDVAAGSKEAAKQLRNLENMLFESDPKSQERKEVAGIIAAVKLLKKRGGGRQNDS